MIRHFATVSLGTLASRLAGFLRDALIAALIGAGAVADIFLIPFQLVSAVRRLIGEGALNAALVPAWLRLRESDGENAAAQFAGRVLSTLTLGLCVLAFAIGCVVPLLVSGLGYDGRPIAIWLMLPYLAFAAPVAVMMALLNAQARFAFAAFTPLLFNVLLIAVAAVLLLWRIEAGTSSLVLAATIGLAGLVQLGVLRRGSGGHTITAARATLDPQMRAFLRQALPGMIASTSPQLLMLTGMAFAATIPGAVSWLYFANRLIELPLGLVGVAMGTVMVPLIARDTDGAAAAEKHAVEIAFALTMPAWIGLAALALPITQVLFEHGAFTAQDTIRTALTLGLLAGALPALAITKTLQASFFGRGRTRTPFNATLAGLLTTLVAAAVMRWSGYGHIGVAGAVTLGAYAQLIWLVVARRREAPIAPDGARFMRCLKIIAAALAMGGTLLYAKDAMGHASSPWLASLQLAALIALGLAVYGLALRALGVVTLSQVRQALAREG